MKTLVLATDGSTYSDAAARCIADKTLFGSDVTVHVVHCMPDLSGDIKSLVGKAEVDAWYAEESTGAMASVCAILGAAGVPFEQHALVGFPPERIVHHAQSAGAAAIVMGSHGRGVFVEALMGSVAGRVLAHAECPVLLVKAPKA